MTCCDACARGAMRATARGTVAVTGSTAGGTTGATVGGSIGGPVGAYVGGAGGAAVGGAAAGKAYDVAAGIVGGGGGGKNAVELDPAAYALAPLADWIDEALWRGASWQEIHSAQAEGDRVTESLDPSIDPDAAWPGLPTRTIRELERALAVQRLVARYPARPGRPARVMPLIGRRRDTDVAPPNRNTSSGSAAMVIGAIAGAALGAGGAWLATRTPRRRRHRMVAMSGAGLAGALAGGYGGARWSR